MCEAKVFKVQAKKAEMVEAPFTCLEFDEGDHVLKIRYSHFNNTGGLVLNDMKESEEIEIIDQNQRYSNLGYHKSKKAIFIAVSPIN